MKVNKLIKKLAFYLLTTHLALGAAFVPQVFFVDLERTTTEELTVMNQTNTPIRYSVSIVPEEGDAWTGYELNPEWVRFYPRVVSVSPNSRGVVRFRINVPSNLADGEYRGNILLEEMITRPENTTDANNSSAEPSMAMGIQNDFMLAIYSHKGDKEYIAKINNPTKISSGENSLFTMNLENTGNATLRPKVEISYLDDRGRTIEKKDLYLEVVPPSISKEYERNLSDEEAIIPNGSASIKYEVYHYDLGTQENVTKLFEGEQSL